MSRSDNFNRPDSVSSLGAPSDGGSNWEVKHQWGISGNAAYNSNSADQNIAILADTDSNVTVTADLSVVETSADLGLVLRATDIYQHLLVTFSRSAEGPRLFSVTGNSVIGSTYTQIGTTGTGNINSGSVVKVDANGTSIKAYIGSTLVLDLTTSAQQTATKHGIRQNGGAGSRFNSFSSVPFSAGADTTPPVITGPTGAAGASSISLSVAEGTTACGTWTANESVTWSLTGTDAARFSISGGVVAFVAAPDFEAPVDAGGNNVYNFNVVATDAASNASSQAVTLTVTDGAEAGAFVASLIAVLGV